MGVHACGHPRTLELPHFTYPAPLLPPTRAARRHLASKRAHSRRPLDALGGRRRHSFLSAHLASTSLLPLRNGLVPLPPLTGARPHAHPRLAGWSARAHSHFLPRSPCWARETSSAFPSSSRLPGWQAGTQPGTPSWGGGYSAIHPSVFCHPSPLLFVIWNPQGTQYVPHRALLPPPPTSCLVLLLLSLSPRLALPRDGQ